MCHFGALSVVWATGGKQSAVARVVFPLFRGGRQMGKEHVAFAEASASACNEQLANCPCLTAFSNISPYYSPSR